MKLFEQNRRLVVPLFQRPYVWKKETQWEPLWEDVRNLAERILAKQEVRPHFIGAIVLEQTPKSTGEIEEREVIDGQQRLTTLQLLLAAVRDICGSSGFVQMQEALDQSTRNTDAMIDIDEQRFKVWPTNVDRDDFKSVMRAGSAEVVRGVNEVGSAELTGRQIPDAYLYFSDAISDWLAEDSKRAESRLKSLLVAIRQQLHLVVIDLGEYDDAQVIFETLNARGTPLLPADLVKSFLLHLADRAEADVEGLYEKYWKPFDESHSYWRKEVAQGRLKRPRIDMFLQNYLTLKTRDEVPVTHIYGVFRSFAAKHPELRAADHFSELTTYAELYRLFENNLDDPLEARFFYRLDQMELSTPVPFLLQLFRQLRAKSDRPARHKVLKAIESFLVRRLVCRLTTKGFNKLFVELIGVFAEGSHADSDAVVDYLLQQDAESTRWPKDDEFKAAWVDSPMYRVLLRRRLRMVLEALEEHRRGAMTERMEIGEKLTVEHVLPQQWREHWDVDGDDARDERNRAVHTIGNLTLINGKLNPSVSNGSWETKRKALKKHSILVMNKEIVEIDEWDEAGIRKRALELFKTAKSLWPRG